VIHAPETLLGPPLARADMMDHPMNTSSRQAIVRDRSPRKRRVRISVELLEGRIAMASPEGGLGASSLEGPQVGQALAFIEPGVRLENDVEITYGETAYLRATLMGRDAPLEGRTISFYAGRDLDLFFGTAVTDAEGVATFALTPEKYRVGNTYYGEIGNFRAIFAGDIQQTSSTSQSVFVRIERCQVLGLRDGSRA
jgi:hypothetical protein